jgi:hypothetical protein
MTRQTRAERASEQKPWSVATHHRKTVPGIPNPVWEAFWQGCLRQWHRFRVASTGPPQGLQNLTRN